MTLLNEIKERLSIFHGLYDDIRIVNPVTKKVYNDIGQKEVLSHHDTEGIHCFDHWGKSSMCKNCVSYKALKNKKTVVKIEKKSDKYFWTLASPVEYETQWYVVELMRELNPQEYLVDDEYSSLLELKKSMFELADMANTDELTSLFNRRYLENQLDKDLLIAKFHQQELCILLLDIDYFKCINDVHGHAIGDLVLKQFASLLTSMLRQKMDWMARLGGEEFVIVLNNTAVQEAKGVANRIREAVEHHTFGELVCKINLTCSIGVSSSTKSVQVSDLLLEADKLLYLAKARGRNKVM